MLEGEMTVADWNRSNIDILSGKMAAEDTGCFFVALYSIAATPGTHADRLPPAEEFWANIPTMYPEVQRGKGVPYSRLLDALHLYKKYDVSVDHVTISEGAPQQLLDSTKDSELPITFSPPEAMDLAGMSGPTMVVLRQPLIMKSHMLAYDGSQDAQIHLQEYLQNGYEPQVIVSMSAQQEQLEELAA